jgi:HSP20 family molecular chaperone IbpA
MKELDAAKTTNMRALSKYEERKDDPFYSIAKLNTDFFDTDDAYVVQAKVPPHEIDNFDVVVQKERISVSGKRSWKDEMALPNGGKIATNRYETIREDVPITKAIREKNVIRSYKDGVLKVIIPKA